MNFIPFAQGDFPSGGLVIRSDVDPSGLSTAARAIVRSIAPEQPIDNVMSLDAIRDESVGPRRIDALLVGAFGHAAVGPDVERRSGAPADLDHVSHAWDRLVRPAEEARKERLRTGGMRRDDVDPTELAGVAWAGSPQSVHLVW